VSVADIDEAELATWCARHLGSAPEETLFSAGNLAKVFGLRLGDGRTVVVKMRPAEPRLAGCTAVQQHLWQAGFPCTQPLAGPLPLAETGHAVNAEASSQAGRHIRPSRARPRCKPSRTCWRG
jgi:hypothetical protein